MNRALPSPFAAGFALAAALFTGCASSFEGPGTGAGIAVDPDAPAATEEHLAALDSIPAAAVRLLEGPTLALDHWEYLDLTVDQLRRLEDLELLVDREREVLLVEIEAARLELEAATDTPFDEARIRAALDRVANARTETSLLTLRARDQTLALLTPEQATLLDRYAREHVHMMMMGWVTEICSGRDALVSDATGAMTPCIAMPEDANGTDDFLFPHIHQE
jgi:Spy/CpxP family protein refolding chaperone